MPKKATFIRLNLNLLKPQGLPEKFAVRLTKWLLSTGRFLIVIVEAVVLIAFVTRFKYDADLESIKDVVNGKIPLIKSLKADENLIRQTQFQLASIKDIRQTSPDYISIMKKIANQTPSGVKIIQLNLSKESNSHSLKISGSTIDNTQLNSFILGLKEEKGFSDINITSIGVERELISFTINGTIKE